MKPTTPAESLPKEFSAAELRYCLITAGRLSQLENSGVVTRVRAGFYAADSIRGYINFLRRTQDGAPRDWQAARVEVARERAAILKLERRQREGELLEKADVVGMNVEIMTVVRNRLLGVPSVTAPRLMELHRPYEAETVVRDAICDALEELSRLAVVAEKPRQRRNGHVGGPTA
jgi:phage terminase Nu1 subunit (DNA packaging protein)